MLGRDVLLSWSSTGTCSKTLRSLSFSGRLYSLLIGSSLGQMRAVSGRAHLQILQTHIFRKTVCYLRKAVCYILGSLSEDVS